MDMRLKFFITIVLLALCLAVLFLAISFRPLKPKVEEKHEVVPPKIELPTRAFIEARFEGVDRVVVKYARQGMHDKDYDDKILFELEGRDALASLQKTIEFDLGNSSEPAYLEPPCLCFGTHDIDFYHKGVRVLSLNYKHFSRLGGLGDGEFDLTSESTKQFAAWFDERGFHDFQKGVDANAAMIRAEEDKARRAAELFPEDYRHKIPPYSQKKTGFILVVDGTDGAMHAQAKEQPREHPLEGRGDRLEILKAAFRAIGTEYGSDENMGGGEYRFDFSDIEPISTLTAILKAGKIEEIRRIVIEGPETDAKLLLGIFRFMNYHWQDWQLMPEYARAKIYNAAWNETAPEKSWRVSSRLSRESGPHCMQLRLKIAAGGNPVAYIDAEEQNEMRLPPWLEVLLALSRQQVPEARVIVLEKLKTAPDGFDKLVLEVALACYDGPEKLNEKHYRLKDYSVAEALKKFRTSVSK